MENQNIQGIYNYCDRWCERCVFTSRCAVYEDESDLTPEERDLNNKAFWDRIGENFAKAQELLRNAAQEYGIDLDAYDPEVEAECQREELLEAETRKHPLALLSFDYSKVARDWLKSQPGMLEHLETLKSELILGVESEEGARKQTQTIRESTDVINWYLHFIHVKLSRALMSQATCQGTEYDPRDYDGSAKIAIIGIDRSISAWTSLFELLPQHEDHFLRVLAMLQQIKSMAIEAFPGSLNFVRPGFDTIVGEN